MYRILLADDEGIMLESLKKIIETEYGNECEIHCAKSGRVVVEMAQAYPPDICFMDIQMPVMNGYDATLAIRKMKDTKKARIPIIAMTANAFAEDAQKGGEEKLQKIHDKYIKQIDDMLAAKDKEIMTV